MASVTGLIELGVKSYSSGRLEEAERFWREALALDPGDGRARAYLDLLAALREAGATPPAAATATTEERAPVVAAPPVVEGAPVVEGEPSPGGEPAAPHPLPVEAPGRRRFALAPGQDATDGVPSLGRVGRRRIVAAAVVLAVLAATALLARVASRARDDGAIGRARGAAVAAWSRLAALPPAVAGLASRLLTPGNTAGGDGAGERPPAQVPGSRTVTSGRSPGPAAGERPAAPAPGEAGALVAIAPAIRWGMGLDELLASAPSASRIPGAHGLEMEGLRALAKARRWELGGRTYQADFLFDGAGRLEAVRLRTPAGGEAEAAFRQLAATLTAELGEPTEIHRDPADGAVWRGRARWRGGRTAADLEGWTGSSDGRVFAVDVQRGGIAPLRDGEVVLTLRAGAGGETP